MRFNYLKVFFRNMFNLFTRRWKRNVSIIAAIFLIVWSVFIKFSSTYGEIISQNSNVLQIAVILLVLILIVRSISNIDSNTLVAIFGVLLALTFFMYQSFQETLDRIQALQTISNTNCELSKNIVALSGTNVPFLDRFSTAVYEQNQGFILNTFGPTAFGIITNATAKMDAENKLLDLINELHVTGNDTLAAKFESNLKTSEGAKVAVCDQLMPILLTKTEEFMRMTTPRALVSMLRGFF